MSDTMGKNQQLGFLEAQISDIDDEIMAFEPEYAAAQDVANRASLQLNYLQSRRASFKAVYTSIAKIRE